MWWIISNFLHEWVTFGVAGACLVGAAVAYFRLPLFGKEAAGVLVSIAVGLWCYSSGFSARADMDKSAELQVTIDTMKRDAAIARLSVDDADQRSGELEKQVSDSDRKVANYVKEQALRKGDTCDLNDADLSGVRGIDGSGTR
jgi:hypothetical protein